MAGQLVDDVPVRLENPAGGRFGHGLSRKHLLPTRAGRNAFSLLIKDFKRLFDLGAKGVGDFFRRHSATHVGEGDVFVQVRVGKKGFCFWTVFQVVFQVGKRLQNRVYEFGRRTKRFQPSRLLFQHGDSHATEKLRDCFKIVARLGKETGKGGKPFSERIRPMFEGFGQSNADHGEVERGLVRLWPHDGQLFRKRRKHAFQNVGVDGFVRIWAGFNESVQRLLPVPVVARKFRHAFPRKIVPPGPVRFLCSALGKKMKLVARQADRKSVDQPFDDSDGNRSHIAGRRSRVPRIRIVVPWAIHCFPYRVLVSVVSCHRAESVRRNSRATHLIENMGTFINTNLGTEW